MSTETTGEKLRGLREQKKLPLRKVAAIVDVDVAILSKMERGERKFTKDIVVKLANLYGTKVNDLLVLFLSDKILFELRNEKLGIKALEFTKQRMKYKGKANEKL